ncbi:MAG: HlyD family efflux transporter periplasmic adaptor subunit [Pirellulaceae bacterium]
MLRSNPRSGTKRVSMLRPEAYNEHVMPSLKLARSARFARLIGKVLACVMVLLFALLAIAPWQQSVRGSGSVLAFSPLERPQPIEAPIKGRIVHWGVDIVENVHVSEGDLIARIQDLDASYLDRLRGQVSATERQIGDLEDTIKAKLRKKEVLNSLVETLEAQEKSYQSIKAQTIAAADAAVESARGKVASERQKALEAIAAQEQIELDFIRQKELHDDNIISDLKLQEAERKKKEADAKVAQAKANVEQALADLENKQSDRRAKEDKAQADIEYATSLIRKQLSELETLDAEIAKDNAELRKTERELLKAETEVARQETQEIVAPFDGFLTQINANAGSQFLKEGEIICTIVPDTADRSVQIWLDGNDAPLVSPGRHVRLQFEGWPAVQFAGWPSVAVGTFGGEVISVDATDNAQGKFRVLIKPDPSDIPWPNENYLRQGVRTNGWVLLEQVPLWYEFWRQMNGFPPVVENAEQLKPQKTPKLPKI